jgi:hypothetical protein
VDRARVRVKLPQVRVHDLKHTFGRPLRAVRPPVVPTQRLSSRSCSATWPLLPWLLSIRECQWRIPECIGLNLLSSQTAIVAHVSWQETLHGGQPSRGRHLPVTAFLWRDGV